MVVDRNLSTDDAREVIACAQHHSPFLEAVRDGTRCKSGLADHLGVSKSTVYNRFNRLACHELVTRTGGRYRLTNRGRLLADVVTETRATVERLQRAGGFIDNIPTSELPPPVVFRDAEVVVGSERPGRPQQVFDRVVRDADRLFGFVPSVHARHLDGPRRIRLDEHTGEVILRAETVEHLLSDHPDSLRKTCRVDGLELFETDRELPFGLVIADEPDELLCLSAHTAHGNESGLLLNDAAAALEWARSTYRTHRQNASRLHVGIDKPT